MNATEERQGAPSDNGGTHPCWCGEAPPTTTHSERALVLLDRPGWLLADERDPAGEATVLVLFDGVAWAGRGIGAAVDRYPAPVHVALVDTSDPTRRTRDLTRLDRLQVLFAGVLDAVGGAFHRTVEPEQVIVAGQGDGGVAAARLATCRPDLVGRAIAQSGTFGASFSAGNAGADGAFMDYLRQRSGAMGMTGLCGRARAGRIVVQSSEADTEQMHHSQDFAETARTAGLVVDAAVYPPSLGRTWWGPGLFDALDHLIAPPSWVGGSLPRS